MTSGVLGASCRAAVEGFLDVGSAEQRRNSYVEFVSMILSFLIALVILSFVGMLLWNNVIVNLFTVVKPARSIWQIIGLMIFVSLLRP